MSIDDQTTMPEVVGLTFTATGGRRDRPPAGGAPLPGTFNRFLASIVASNLGDGVRLTAFPLLASTLTRDPLAIGAVAAATMAPWLLGPLGGAVVDRGDRQRLMIAGQVARGLAVGALATAVLLGGAPLWAIYVVALVVGTGEVLVDSAAQAVLPALVGPDQLERANGRLVAGTTVTDDVVGGPFGGWLFALGAGLPFLFDAVTFLVAALLLVGVRTPRTPDAGADAEAGGGAAGVSDARGGFWDDVREGLQHLLGDPLLRALAGIVGAVNVAMTASVSILVLFVLEDLGLPEGAYGVLLGTGAVGGLLGSWAAPRVRQRFGRGPSLVTAVLAACVGMGVLATSTAAWQAALALMALNAGGATFAVVGRSLRQAVIPERLLGRVTASFRVIGLGGVPVGAFAGGALARAVSVRATLTASAALLGLLVLGMALTVRRIPAAHR